VIDCPICHVKNNDDARFCAECGQRLTGQSSTSSLTEPTPALPPRSAAPSPQQPQQPPQQPAQAPPPPAQAAPPPADQHRPRLKSPLLSGDEDYGGGPQQFGAGQAGTTDDAGVNRLRQMGNRPEPGNANPSVDPNRPFKNPYDPRNSMPQDQQQPSSGEAHRKLRSPLLSGEEFDDSDFAEQDPPPSNVRGGGLRSPLLGGGEGGGGLRSPMLGGGRGQQQYEEDYDDEPQGGGGLRSPLLGGGAGGAGYSGAERRRAADQQYGGTERRKGGLRSPILGGGTDEYYDDYYEDDEAIDEDNPNVLRSPLLAAKRPLSDRPRNESAPAQSNMQNPPPAGQMPDIGRNLPSPSSSYTSLRSIKNAGGPAQQPPQMVPPAPQEPQPQPYSQRPYEPQQPMAPAATGGAMPGPGPQSAPPQPSFGSPSPTPPGPPSQPSGPPQSVPPSFSRHESQPMAPQPAPSVPTAQPVRPDEISTFNRASGPSTEGSINVQPPISNSKTPSYKDDAATDEPVALRGKRRAGLLSNYDGDNEESEYAAPSPFQSNAPASPLPKIICAIASILFLVKTWSFMTGFMSSDWRNFSWLMMDQLTMIGMYLCVAILAFTRRD
jgi:hypothetical protein